jgi:cytochrome c oxidase cbb3-type subunit 3
MNPTNESRDAEPSNGALTTHTYDGIEEYDNPLPAWWRRIFWGTAFFSLCYFVHYQLTGNGATAAQSYETDMREFREMVAAKTLGTEINEDGLTRLMNDPMMMRDARTVFSSRCVQCHADRGQGNIGPNLTDDHWLNGDGSLTALLEIVKDGRPQKGMPTWGQKLRPVELAQVVAYVGSIRNTNVPGRAPQGTLVAVHAATSPEVAPTGGE